MKIRVLSVLVALGAIAAYGCRDDNSGGAGSGGAGHGGTGGAAGSTGGTGGATGGTGGSTGGTGGSAGSTGGAGGSIASSIHDLRMTPPGPQTPVTLTGVVIVARVTSSRSGHVWVQDQGGGVYSGIHLFCSFTSTSNPCPMNRQQIGALNRGQVVNVSGVYDPFTPTMPAGSPIQLEIGKPMITPTGTMMTPVATNVTAAMVAKDQLTAESYKGVYVKVTDGPFAITSTMPNAFQTTCSGDGGMETIYSGVEATSGSSVLAVALNLYDSVTYCLPGCFPCSNELTNQHFSTVAGIIEPGSNQRTNAIYLEISPTEDADLAP